MSDFGFQELGEGEFAEWFDNESGGNVVGKETDRTQKIVVSGGFVDYLCDFIDNPKNAGTTMGVISGKNIGDEKFHFDRMTPFSNLQLEKGPIDKDLLVVALEDTQAVKGEWTYGVVEVLYDYVQKEKIFNEKLLADMGEVGVSDEPKRQEKAVAKWLRKAGLRGDSEKQFNFYYQQAPDAVKLAWNEFIQTYKPYLDEDVRREE